MYFNTIIPKYFKMYFKSCTIGHVFVFYIFAKVKYFLKILFKLSYVPCCGRNVTKFYSSVMHKNTHIDITYRNYFTE